MKKKIDRRTLYTQAVVKDAFLALIAEMPYDRINVTGICRKADISRATFYLHFDNVDHVLDQVIDDALLFSETAPGTMLDMLDMVPACQRIADSDRYHALFLDPLVSDHIIRRIAQHERDSVVLELMKRGNITEEEAEVIFRFILQGSFAVNRSLNWQKNAHWYRCQELIGHFVRGGLKEIPVTNL